MQNMIIVVNVITRNFMGYLSHNHDDYECLSTLFIGFR